MKLCKLAASAALTGCFASAAIAQSSVTLYGIIDVGVNYVNNSGGKSKIFMLSGELQNNRLGFRIGEDLGNGLHAIAVLENGFDVTDGQMQQGGRLWGRQAWVGLKSDQYGQLTLGRQYDEVWDYLTKYEIGINLNDLAIYIGDNNNAFASFRYSNSIKYTSPIWNGFSFAGLYAMSNEAGNFAANSAYSLGVGFQRGPFTLGAAYVELRQPGTVPNASGAVTNDYGGTPFQPFETSPHNAAIGVETQRIAGIGGSYAFSQITINAMFSNVHYNYRDGTSLRLSDWDVNAVYMLTPFLGLGAGYVYTQGRISNATKQPAWQMASIDLDYLLSKRTDAEISFVGMKASGGAAPVLFVTNPSTTQSQILLSIGIRHKF
ncbi:porin [Paraburkholderia sediminicola]|uniref:porin n=1 Tax=Paraburkholderia sediminicola TaxID=458836 RepID=UPI0038B819CA